MADITVTIPAAPKQAIQQVLREVTYVVGPECKTIALSVESTGPVQLRAAVDAQCSVEVVEVLANGRRSQPVGITFTPYSRVEAVSADPSGFVVQVAVVEESAAGDNPVPEVPTEVPVAPPTVAPPERFHPKL